MASIKPTESAILNPGDPIRPEKPAPSKLLAGVVPVGGFIVLSMVLQQFRGNQPGIVRGKSPAKTVSINREETDKDIYMKDAGARIEALDQQRDQMRRLLEQDGRDKTEIKTQLSDLQKRIESVARSGGGISPGTKSGALPPLPPPLSANPVGGGSATPVSAMPVPKGPIPVQSTPKPAGGTLPAPGAGGGLTDGFQVFRPEIVPGAKKNEKKLWLNTGTIIPVKLLSGMDAPARSTGAQGGGASANSPYPVLMMVRDIMKLPNEARIDAKDCFLVGEGLGDLSSERVMIRGNALSCVKKNGEAVDIELKGFVSGEDGKQGMRGRVVLKEGALLGRTLLAGFVSGISRAFMPYQSGFFVAQSPSQAFNLPPAGPVAMSGMAGGAGRAAELLARHYSMMAASIFPVIEIDAQREVDFIVGTGRELEGFFQ